MSIFSPRGLLGVIGVILALVALYLVLEHFGSATAILGALSTGGIGILGTLQGRTTSISTGAGSVNVGASA